MKVTNPDFKKKPQIKAPYTSLYLIRHCQPNYQLQDKLGDLNMPLSDIGLAQRKLLNRKIFKLDIDVIYVSEFLRSRQTAEPLAEKIKKQPIVDTRLNEIVWRNWFKVKYFNMSEKTRIRRFKKYRQLNKELDQVQTQARRLLADFYRENTGKKMAIFCHGNLIRTVITSILNSDIIGFLSIEIYQSSITKIVVDRDGFVKINYINNIGHLPHRPEEDLFLASINQ